MSIRISQFTYTCNICLCEKVGIMLPDGWIAHDKGGADHSCAECLQCFDAWRESRRQAVGAKTKAHAKRGR